MPILDHAVGEPVAHVQVLRTRPQGPSKLGFLTPRSPGQGLACGGAPQATTERGAGAHMQVTTQRKLGSLWTPTGGLFAIAAGLVILAIATGNSIFSHRYQFAPSSFVNGQAVWRGDTITGHAVLCATRPVIEGMESREEGKGIVTKC